MFTFHWHFSTQLCAALAVYCWQASMCLHEIHLAAASLCTHSSVRNSFFRFQICLAFQAGKQLMFHLVDEMCSIRGTEKSLLSAVFKVKWWGWPLLTVFCEAFYFSPLLYCFDSFVMTTFLAPSYLRHCIQMFWFVVGLAICVLWCPLYFYIYINMIFSYFSYWRRN